MSLGHGSSPVRNGLVFQYDMANVRKSYKGAPFTNITKSIYHANYGSVASNVYGVAGTEYVNIPEVGRTFVKYNDFYNHYNQIEPNSTNCCPSPIHYGLNVPTSPSTLYTYMILYKTESGYSHQNFMYRYERNSSGTILTQGGVHSTGRRVHLGNGWYYAWGTFTTQATTAKADYRLFYYRYSSIPDKISVAKAMVVAGDYSELHPKYWIEPETTRANTQALIDISGSNNTVTVNSLSYNTDGSFEFDGTDDYISHPAVLPEGQNKYSIEATFYISSMNGASRVIWEQNTSSTVGSRRGCFLVISSGKWGFNGQSNDAHDKVPVDFNAWQHGVITVDTTDTTNPIKLYKNGELYWQGNTSNNASNLNLGVGGCAVGHKVPTGTEHWFGKIDYVNVYSRTLTAQEVKQNFESTRGRYGI